jgi:dipeptidyl aminopeptidase/acylaminoacyl peptidase
MGLFSVGIRRLAWMCLVAGLAVCFVLGHDAQAQRIPSMGDGAIQDFLRHSVEPARYSQAELSPSGRHLLAVQERGGDQSHDTLIIFDLDAEGGPVGRRLEVGEHNIDWIAWASEDHFLVSISSLQRVYIVGGSRRNPTRRFLPVPSRIYTIERESLSLIATLMDDARPNFNNRSLSRITDILPDDPDHVLMPAYNRRNYNLYRVNILTGESDKLETGTAYTTAWFTAHGEAVMRADITHSGRHLRFYGRREGRRSWRRVSTVRSRDLFGARPDFEWAGPSDQAGQVFVRGRPEGAEFFGIYRYDLEEGTFGEAVVVRDDYDVHQAIIGTFSGDYAGYVYQDDRLRFVYDDPDIADAYRRVDALFRGEAVTTPVSIGGSRLLFFVQGPNVPGVYYLFDRDTDEIEPMLFARPNLESDDLRAVTSVRYAARDGTEIQGYFTEPRTGANATTPLIVYPHGGPELRDTLEFDPVVQYLTALGYAVFQPNYRGSSGFGRSFAEAGYREWGGLMQDDISDGVRWLIEEGRADPDQICIVGFSYGGYAALAGAATTPDLYRCAIAGAPVTEFFDFLDFKEDSSDDVYDYWVDLLGNPRADRADRADMTARSPVHMADQITIPVFLYHGDDDDLVPVEQSRRMAEAMTEHGVDHVYLEVPDGRHNWGQGRAFIVMMRHIATYLEDAMDGSIDTFAVDGDKPDGDD